MRELQTIKFYHVMETAEIHCPSEMVFGLEGKWEQSIQRL